MKKSKSLYIPFIALILSFSGVIFCMDQTKNHPHPKKHRLNLGTHTAQSNDASHILKKIKNETISPQLEALKLVPYTPTAPIEHEKTQQYGLQLLDAANKQVGFVNFELFPEENDEDSDEEDTRPVMNGEITFLFITKPYRKNGYGKQLLDTACSLLQEKGCQEIMLTASPENSSYLEKLVKFYQNAGFRLEEDFDLSQLEEQDEDPGIPMYKTITQ